MGAIPFPGIPGGINWRIRLDIPRIDLFKQTDPLPPELSMGPGQFSGSLDVELCIDCRRLRIDPKPPRPKDPRSEEHTSELQSLMRTSYTVFCMKKQKKK